MIWYEETASLSTYAFCLLFVTFHVRLSRGEMYSVHGRLCVCVRLSLAAFPHYCTYPYVTWRMVRVPPSCALLGRFEIGCTGFVAMTSQRRTRNVSECLYSLYVPGYWLHASMV